MATVPGDPNDNGTGNGRDPYGGIPPGLRPGYPELLMAAAIHKQQQDQKPAGEVIPFPGSRTAIQFEALDPKDEGVVEGKVPMPKPRPKKEKT